MTKAGRPLNLSSAHLLLLNSSCLRCDHISCRALSSLCPCCGCTKGPHGKASCLQVTNCPPACCDSSQGCYTFIINRAAQVDESRKWKSPIRAVGRLAMTWMELIPMQACKLLHISKFFCNCAFFTTTVDRSQTPWLFLLGNTFFTTSWSQILFFARGSINKTSHTRADAELFPDTALLGLLHRTPKHPFI